MWKNVGSMVTLRTTQKMARWLAIALINCDSSGLEETDLELYNSISFHFTVTDWAEDSQDINGRCDFTKLHDHVVTIEVEY